MNFEDLKGMIFTKVEQKGDDELHFYSIDDRHFMLYHSQDCCESVTIEDICGDLRDLENTPLLLVEEAVSNDCPPGSRAIDSDTWTFYKLRTIKGSVDIRWHGVSNGYYSESVNFREVPNG